MESPEHPFLSDAFVASEIDRALAPFSGVLDASELAWMRAALAAELAEDGELQGLLAAVHPSTIDVSGERLRPWLELVAAVEAREVG